MPLLQIYYCTSYIIFSSIILVISITLLWFHIHCTAFQLNSSLIIEMKCTNIPKVFLLSVFRILVSTALHHISPSILQPIKTTFLIRNGNYRPTVNQILHHCVCHTQRHWLITMQEEYSKKSLEFWYGLRTSMTWCETSETFLG